MARTRCPPEGTRVRFRPNPVSMMLYSAEHRRFLPPAGTMGSVTSLPVGRGNSTCMPGPGGGLIYVDWDEGGTIGTSRYDLEFGSEKQQKAFGAVGTHGTFGGLLNGCGCRRM